jgi:hypothetical protein
VNEEWDVYVFIVPDVQHDEERQNAIRGCNYRQPQNASTTVVVVRAALPDVYNDSASLVPDVCAATATSRQRIRAAAFFPTPTTTTSV